MCAKDFDGLLIPEADTVLCVKDNTLIFDFMPISEAEKKPAQNPKIIIIKFVDFH